jgi:hypothetical protein
MRDVFAIDVAEPSAMRVESTEAFREPLDHLVGGGETVLYQPPEGMSDRWGFPGAVICDC